MTLFSASDIPASIKTYEQLMVWNASVLAYLHPEMTQIEALDVNGNPIEVRAITGNSFFNTATAPSQWLFIGRISAEVLADHVAGPTWNYVKSFGDATVPVFFKQ